MAAVIYAKGKRAGKSMEVVCIEKDGIHLFFNDHLNVQEEQDFMDIMKERHVIDGTFCPEEDSMLNALNMLRYYYFDEPPDIRTEGEFEELPNEDGIVY